MTHDNSIHFGQKNENFVVLETHQTKKDTLVHSKHTIENSTSKFRNIFKTKIQMEPETKKSMLQFSTFYIIIKKKVMRSIILIF